MKKIILTILILLTTNIYLFSQDKKASSMYFGALTGTKINDFNNHFALDVDPLLYSFSIGAGAAWTKNNYVVGFDFLYSAAQNDNSEGEIQYVGFSNTLSLGYNVSKSKIWKIEPNLGVVINNNQLIVQNKNNTIFQNLVNNQLSGNIGLNVKAVGNNGLFTGLKIGYIIPFSGETEWENKVDGTASGLKDNVGSFYVQLNLGGLLNLNNEK
ncbi:hypothetical protein [Aquiflexum lacus]|uniref:hypothetical protein n=1 Tax=Aquiflexum lacus TaxID=2483805 RepID=UPI0018945C6F|nr:hypothetical protein [Aquiflexum lacus]